MSASTGSLTAGSAEAAEAPVRRLARAQEKWQPTVLIVEDHREVAESLRQALAKMKILGIVSPNGETALRMAGLMHFDLVILDILLPGKNGFEVFTAMRELPLMRDVPIMVLTCLTDETSKARGKALGAVHYLCKPFELPEFQVHVERILSAEAERQAQAQAIRPTGT
jgi:two-component system copper resistance phosphate regulon response regulator CusR